jgi:hypothetical protein
MSETRRLRPPQAAYEPLPEDDPTERRPILRWLAWQLPLLFVIAGFIVYSHAQRVDEAKVANRTTQAVVRSAREQCAASQQRTYENMEAWYGAYIARRQDAVDPLATPGARSAAAQAAADYLSTIRNDMRLTDRAHSVTWPRGAKGKKAHPLGLGHFSCVRANPYPAPIKVEWYQVG